MDREFKKKGSFSEVLLPTLLVEAFHSRFTGMFRAEKESIIKVIYFREGEIAFASSNQPSDRLGEVLIKRGQLSREQLDLAMSKLEPNVSLGKMLVELGFLTPKELLEGAKTQVEEILYSLTAWNEGNYEFLEGPLPQRIVNLNLNTRQVIVQSILRVENRRWVLEQIGGMDKTYAREDDFNDIFRTMKFDEDVSYLLTNVDGHNTVRDLCNLSRLDDFVVGKVVAAFYLLKMLKPVEVAVAEEEVPGFLAEGARIRTETDKTQEMETPILEETMIGGAGYGEETKEEEPLEEQFEEEKLGVGATTEAAGEEELPEVTEEMRPGEEEAVEETLAEEEGEEEFEEVEPEKRRRIMTFVLPIVALLVIGLAAYFVYSRFLAVKPGKPGPKATPVAGLKTTPAPVQTPPAAIQTPVPIQTTAPGVIAVPGRTPSPVATVPGLKPTGSPTAISAVLPRLTPAPAQRTVTPAAGMTATAGPVRTPTPEKALKTPTPRPTAIALATPKPRPTPETTRPIPGQANVEAFLSSGSQSLLAGDYDEAASTYGRNLHSLRGTKYTIQLELACQKSTIDTGLKEGNRSPQYFILRERYRGKRCYAACWGIYDSRQEAVSALRTSVPAFFRTQVHPPIVVPIRKFR
jgi:hypothetical protein